MKMNHQTQELPQGDSIFVLQDHSVLVQQDTLVNQHLKEKQLILKNQRIKQISRNNGFTHSYQNKPQFHKYDDNLQLAQSPIQKNIPKNGINLDMQMKKPSEFKDIRIPKRRKRKKLTLQGDTLQSLFYTRKQVQQKKKPIQLNINPLTDQDHIEKESQILMPYNDTESFLESIQLSKKTFTLQDSVKGHTSIVNVQLPSELHQQKPVQLPQTTWEAHQIHMSRGLSECLQLLRQRGQLNQIRTFGRNKDKTEQALVYRDQDGRVLTQKEAFRQQCQSHHNQTPNLRKIKKLTQQYQKQAKLANTQAYNGTSLVKQAKLIMKKSNEPFIRITNH